MRVDGSSQGNNADVVARLQELIKGRGAARPASPEQTGENEALESPTVEAAEGEGGGQQGVIRLLQEGHFRGVADVRLRINFSAELQGIQAGKVGDTLKSGLSALQSDVNDAIDAIVDGGTLSEEDTNTLRTAQDAFNTKIGALLESDKPTNEVFGELRTAFEDFLKGLVPPQAEDDETSILPIETQETSEETPATPTVPATDVTTSSDTTDVFAGLRDTLSGIFDSAVSSLQDSLDALTLPPLSEPQGNGKAYEKFLVTYNQLYGTGDAATASTAVDGLNATA